MRWISRQQGVKKRRAAAGKSKNKNRFADLLSGDLRAELSIPNQKQTVAQNSHDIVFERELPDNVQPRLVFARFQQ
ncbi:MAG TPA: hypothetical protein VKS98_09270, partial [Chthoniobacterales bacterium]|nr:hypothetical protein [Chthoniobacterales bacterium]